MTNRLRLSTLTQPIHKTYSTIDPFIIQTCLSQPNSLTSYRIRVKLTNQLRTIIPILCISYYVVIMKSYVRSC